MYLLDTDILIWVLRGRKDIVDKVSQLNKKSALSISAITVAEIYQNVFPSELTITEDHVSKYKHINVDSKIAKIGGLYWQQYSKKLKNLSLTDCLIAATANVHNLTLVSLNTKHFPMKDIQVMKP